MESLSPTSVAYAWEAISTSRTSRAARAGRSSTSSTRTFRRRGRSTGFIRATPSARTAGPSSSGASARSGRWTSRKAPRGGVEVPFKVRVEAALHDALRFPQKVYEDRFPVRMIRQAATSPDGRTVVFSALGRLYRKDLPDGEPRRLTERRRHRARARDSRGTAPSSSTRPGATSTEGGSGSFAPTARTGETSSKRPATTPSPSFSPDGKSVVYRRTRGDSIRGEAFGTDPGIYVVAMEGGSPRLVREAGEEPEVLVGWRPHLVRRAPRGQDRPRERRPRLVGSESGDRASRVRERRRDRAFARRTVRRFRRALQGPRRAVPEDGPRGQPRSRVELRSR